MGVTAGVTPHVTPTEGGVSQKQVGGVSHLTLPFFPVAVRVFRPSPSDPNRASGEGQDGSDPPLFVPLARHGGGGVSPPASRPVSHAPPPVVGSLPSLGIPAGRLRRRPQAGARRDRLIRAFLVIGGVSLGCAWT